MIFVPKHQDKQSILYPMDKGQQIAIYNEFEVNKDKSKYIGENILIFLKQIYDKKCDKEFDWVFATNVEWILFIEIPCALGTGTSSSLGLGSCPRVNTRLLEKIITTYKKRWRIETQFRVHDEARIKCKSSEMKIRYFLFLFEQMLQVQWIYFYKDDCSFKEFIMAMADISDKWTKNQSK